MAGTVIFFAVTLLAVAAALPFLAEALRKPMNDNARRSAPGDFAALSQGLTHFQWRGPKGGPVIVCIHGLTTPGFVWNSLADGLANAGFRVLTYDLFGRGYSDRPPGRQTPAFFVRQLDDLLAHQKVGSGVTLIAYSMGAVTAAAFAARSDRNIQRLVLLAPAGMSPVSGGAFGKALRLPVLGYWLMLARYPAFLRRGLREEAVLPTTVPDITRHQRAELDYSGFLPAVHSSLLEMLTKDTKAAHETVAQSETPVLAVWGSEDAVIPITAKERLSRWNGRVEHHMIDDAGHGLPYSHTRQVLEQILRFLS